MRARDARGRFIRPLPKQSRVKDLSGETFGRLFVVRFCGRRKTKSGTQALWLVRCSCGRNKRQVISTVNLTSGNTSSCGCLRDIEAIKRCKERITHGHSVRDSRGHVSTEYTAYCSARQRCTDPNVRRWKSYGGANPPVKFLWISFQQFIDEVGCKPKDGRYSLGRENDTGDYGPNLGNSWQTDEQQIVARYAKRNGYYTAQQQAKYLAAA